MANSSCTAFQGTKRIASGPRSEVALKVKAVVDRGEASPILIFDDVTAEPVEVDFRGSPEAVVARLGAGTDTVLGPAPEPRRPGRPKLGVVAREVTLLPRHWDWLARQPGGASVALRKLVEGARRESGVTDPRREAQEAAYRFMSALAGNEPGYEEATRALFAGNEARFAETTVSWPRDIRDYASMLAAPAFAETRIEASSGPKR